MNKPIWIKWGREAAFRVRLKPSVHATHNEPHKGRPFHVIFDVHRSPFHGRINSMIIGAEGWMPKRGGWYYVKPISLYWRSWPLGHERR